MFVALVIQHGKSMRFFILSYAVCLILQYFSTLSNKRHDLRGGGGVIEYKMHAVIFSTTFVSNIFHCKKNLARYYQKFKNLRIEILVRFQWQYRQFFGT